jgi:hypothetical protein
MFGGIELLGAVFVSEANRRRIGTFRNIGFGKKVQVREPILYTILSYNASVV